MRIAFGGISVENGSFSPLHTKLEDFVVLRGQELLASERYPFLPDIEAEFLPTLFASAWPGGEMEREAYQVLKDDLLERLVGYGLVDGVYLDLHGAMKVVGMEDAEADLAQAVRAVVGPDALISASMDLHGNISDAYIAQIDMLSAYRTAPHRDMLETRTKACRMLVDALQAGERPYIVSKSVAVLLPGERTRTDMAPGDRLWASLAEIEKSPAILDASLFVGFAWVDEARAHAAAVVTGLASDAATVERECTKLAQAYWEARTEFGYGVEVGSIDGCIALAAAATESTVFISDSGDNPTAGAAGDIPLFVERLLAHRDSSTEAASAPRAVVAAIPDAETVERCRKAGIGARVEVELGGKLDTIHGSPLQAVGTVQTIVAGTEGAGDQVVLQVENVKIVVTERRKPFTTVADFEQVGIDPLAHKIVVVKLGYLFPDLLRVAPRALMALSPGASDLDLARLPYQQIKRPMWPIDG